MELFWLNEKKGRSISDSLLGGSPPIYKAAATLSIGYPGLCINCIPSVYCPFSVLSVQYRFSPKHTAAMVPAPNSDTAKKSLRGWTIGGKGDIAYFEPIWTGGLDKCTRYVPRCLEALYALCVVKARRDRE